MPRNLRPRRVVIHKQAGISVMRFVGRRALATTLAPVLFSLFDGVFQDVLFGSGDPSIIYADFGNNFIEVFATDTAGNTSAPATVTVVFRSMQHSRRSPNE